MRPMLDAVLAAELRREVIGRVVAERNRELQPLLGARGERLHREAADLPQALRREILGAAEIRDRREERRAERIGKRRLAAVGDKDEELPAGAGSR